jgi:signal transduction histidine kinase/CheY-like chemotaxis protein
VLAALRREVALACDAEGRIVWADEIARAWLGVHPGERLTDHAPPEGEAKVAALIHQVRLAPVDNWEVSLAIRGEPAVLTFRGRAQNGTVILVGSIGSDDGSLRLPPNGAPSELASLHRETERQQRELLRRNEQLVRLNREIEDSTRGMVALHAEVEEKNDSLRRVNEVKSRVVSNVTHEFRTPLNSIVGLSQILLSRTDGDLTPEQEKQITFIRRSAESLSDLVNDLLDLSKVEAGKVAFRPAEFTAASLFAALRGMLRPLATNEHVRLVFEEPPDIVLETDEGKVSQVLRNLLSNAMKFTERGEIRVRAAAGPNDSVSFAVSDTGIGISPEDHERVFEEFAQIEHPLQRKVKGTGLGLALSRRLAEILGGAITLTSMPGAGSTFTLTIPRLHPEVKELAELTERSQQLDPAKAPVLVLEDDRQTLFLYERHLRGSGFQIVPARSIDEARAALERMRPAAIVLDIMLEGESSWSFLADLKSNPETKDIPVLVVTVTNRESKARALGADEFFVKPLDQQWIIKKLASLARRSGPITTVLVIDDDDVARYMLRKMLTDVPYHVIEASDGAEGVRLARQMAPQIIFLDFMMPGMNAFDVLDELKIDPRTRSIPVIVHTARNLAEDERERLAREASAILPKENLTKEVAIGRIREALQKAVGAGTERGEVGSV